MQEQGQDGGPSNTGLLKFTIPIEPVSVQKGNRTTARGGKVIHYSDKRKVSYYASIAAEVKHHALITGPLEGPIMVEYRFYIKRPLYLMKKNSPPGAFPCDQKPDFDNLTKGLGDALGNAGVFTDDKQIWAASVFKLYHELALFPRIEVEIKYEKRRQNNK